LDLLVGVEEATHPTGYQLAEVRPEASFMVRGERRKRERGRREEEERKKRGRGKGEKGKRRGTGSLLSQMLGESRHGFKRRHANFIFRGLQECNPLLGPLGDDRFLFCSFFLHLWDELLE
jgi:hypothetical protein